MMKIRNIQLNKQPNIAVAFTDKNFTTGANVDIAEIRVDQFSSFETNYICQKLRKFADVPSIVTIRKHDEDKLSQWHGSEEERLALFKDILTKVQEIDAFDIELKADDILNKVIEAVHQHQKLAIVSFHDFEKTPSLTSLVDIIHQAKSLGADIVKIAVKINNEQDIKILEQLTKKHKDKGLIIIGMGKNGIKTRIELPLLGSLVTFACSDGYCSAPGQLTYQETNNRIQQLSSMQSTRSAWKHAIKAMPAELDEAFDNEWLSADLVTSIEH